MDNEVIVLLGWLAALAGVESDVDDVEVVVHWVSESACMDLREYPDALDVEVEVQTAHGVVEGDVTLLRGPTGQYGAWGAPDNWASPELLEGLARLEGWYASADLLSVVNDAASQAADEHAAA